MTIATPADVEAAIGRPLSTQESAQAQYLLTYTEAILTRRLGDLYDATADDDPTLDQVKMVEVNSVVRVLRNPAGVKSETAGPFQVSLDTSGRAGQLYISEDDWALLGVSGATGAFSIAPTYAANDPADPSLAVTYSGATLPSTWGWA